VAQEAAARTSGVSLRARPRASSHKPGRDVFRVLGHETTALPLGREAGMVGRVHLDAEQRPPQAQGGERPEGPG
jgi:hypothetical protein